MKNILISIILLFTGYLSFSQDKIFVLHPFVGDTIDNYEKNKFLLFPEINDSYFRFGQIHLIDNKKYLLYSYSNYGSVPKISEIDSLTIKECAGSIQKYIDYYTSLLKNPDLIHTPASAKNQKDLKVNLNISPEFYKKLASEVVRYQCLKGAAELKGLWGKDKENYIQTGWFLTIPKK
jgi:hypothetical protein